MSRLSEEKTLTHEQEAMKAAFARAVRMAGGGTRMAAAIGVDTSSVSRWERMNYFDCPPGHLYTRIDAAAGYPCMLEAIAVLAGYSIRKEEVEQPGETLLSEMGTFAVNSGRMVQAIVTAKADNVICIRDLNLIEAEGKTIIANTNRIMETARFKYEQGCGAPVRMTGAAR